MKIKFLIWVVALCLTSVAVAASCAQGLEAFRTTLYPKLRANCIACHGDGGRATPHSQASVPDAYQLARGLVNFYDLAKSRFVRKVRSAHWLDEDETALGMTEVEMLKSLQGWWDTGERECPPPFKFTTSEQDLPRDLPNRDVGFKMLLWDLSSFGGEFSGCQFRLDVQHFLPASGDIPLSLRVRNPRIVCPRGKTVIQGLRVLLSGQSWPYENLYDGLNVETLHDGGEQSLSTDLMILVAHGMSSPKLSIGFVGLSSSAKENP